jgi:pimeloyl-ACP methyl ester carboxylesterase
VVKTTELSANGFRFTLDIAGEADAPLVLLLHGFPQTRHTWRHELPALAAAGYRGAAPDQRGYSPGARPSGAAHYGADALVADALALADALASEGTTPRFHLVGHDWGGQLAWLLAVRHPERVRSLAVLSRPHPAAFAGAMASDAAQSERSKHHRAFQDPKTADLLLENGARRLRGMLHAQGVPEADIDAYVTPLSQHAALDAALNWYRAAFAGSSALALKDLPPARVPTLFVWGDADATVGRIAAEATRAHVAAPYRFVVVPGAGHFLTDQQPAAVTRALLEHLAEHADA